MTLTIELPPVRDGWQLLALHGELDLQGATALREAVATVADRGAERLLLDLRGLTRLDPPGLGALVAAARCLPHTRLAGLSGPARSSYEATGLQRVIPLHDDLDGALAA